MKDDWFDYRRKFKFKYFEDEEEEKEYSSDDIFEDLGVFLVDIFVNFGVFLCIRRWLEFVVFKWLGFEVVFMNSCWFWGEYL